MHEDGAFVDAGENDNLIVQKLLADPKAIGVFGYSFLEENTETLSGNTLNGVAPTYASISDFSYPGARPLYIYVKSAHLKAIKGLQGFVAEFATALRSVGEPMRGQPVKDMSVGNMLDSLFAITRDFDMATQPHLLLLQKTMVMVEGVATGLDPDINMWEVAEPVVRDWLRGELGPEARIADRLIKDVRTLSRLPELLRRLEALVPPEDGAPLQLPLIPIDIVGAHLGESVWRYGLVALVAAGAGAGVILLTAL